MAPGPKTLLFVFVVVVLLPGQVDCLRDRQDEVPQLTVTPQQQRHSLKEEECPAVNTLLDASATPGKGHVKETIQDQLVAPKSFSMKKVMQALLRLACERNRSFPHLPFLLEREAALKKQSSA
ncbi:uncharacterized protein LOC144578934 [Callithrix jacchus]